MEETESILRAGYRLDRYELLCPIASGGMAAVWLARLRGKRGFEKLVAVKTIKSELSDDPRFEEMFLDEARIASGIQHPNVAQIIDLGEQDKILYLVMEWVDGESLSMVRRMASKRGNTLPLGVALRVIADACAGLHAAHELKDAQGNNLGVVHRDVSPQNILVSAGGSVKIIDFGIAKARNRSAANTRTGTMKGKIHYMAPEQALGKSVDRRVDIWAIGACLQELVTNRLPFEGEDEMEVVRKLMTNEPPVLEGEMPEVVEQLIRHSVARDPDKRFMSASAMQRAVEAAMMDLELASTSDDVAAFVNEHLGERATKRQEIVSKALAAARARVDENPTPPPSAPIASSGTTAKLAEPRPRDVTPAAPVYLAPEVSAQTEATAELAAGVPRRGSGWMILLGLLVIGGLAAFFVLWQGEGSRPLTNAAPAAASPPGVSASAVASGVPATSASPVPSARPATAVAMAPTASSALAAAKGPRPLSTRGAPAPSASASAAATEPPPSATATAEPMPPESDPYKPE